MQRNFVTKLHVHITSHTFLLLQLHLFKSDLLRYLLSLWQSFHLLGALQSDLVYVYKDQELLKVQALGWPTHKQKNEWGLKKLNHLAIKGIKPTDIWVLQNYEHTSRLIPMACSVLRKFNKTSKRLGYFL